MMDILERIVKSTSSKKNYNFEHEKRKDKTDKVEIIVYDNIEKNIFKNAYFIDGIQDAIILKYVDNLPIILVSVSSGYIDIELNGFESKNKTFLICRKGMELIEYRNSIEIIELDIDDAELYQLKADEIINENRDKIEEEVACNLFEDGCSMIFVDGSIRSYDGRDNIVGVIKSNNTKYLKDERELYSLDRDEISSIFKFDFDGKTIYSLYYRLFSNVGNDWDYGLVRLESYNIDTLIMSLDYMKKCRQNEGSSDSRKDRHLKQIKTLEEYLKYTRHYIFKVI